MTTEPKIEATEDPETHFLSFKCPWCHKIHRHGKGFGFRQSRCRLYNGEYELIPVIKKCFCGSQAMAYCDDCSQWFCVKHFNEHKNKGDEKKDDDKPKP